MEEATGPLDGLKVIEMGSVGRGPLEGGRVGGGGRGGPVPHAAMLLADMGAEVVRVDRPSALAPGGSQPPPPYGEVTLRGRRSIVVDLKHHAGQATLLDLVRKADVLIEGFRPGVMERLGLGPDDCLAVNPRMVYGRMTGYGQDGPLSHAAGHDLNYIAFAGALAHFGRPGERPSMPLNLVGDYGGGSMYLLFGVMCALYERAASGQGQVVDAAMVDGIASLMSLFWGYSQIGRFDETKRGAHHFDGGAHFFDVYECSDHRFISVGAIEPQFYAELLQRLGLADDPDFAVQYDKSRWPELKLRLIELFATGTRDEWCALLEGTDACFAPLLTLSETAAHPHTAHRRTLVEVCGIRQAAPAPRLSRTPGRLGRPPAPFGQDTVEVLSDWGVPAERVQELLAEGAVARPE
jgi:alpha-methylacyl-CoA racemase